MLNQIILVGRLTNDVEKIKTESGTACAKITLAVPRSFKNAEGIFETDFIPCILWNGIAENTIEWCRKGDLIGIKGRVQSNENQIEIIAERVTFLSSKKKEEMQND